MHVLDDLVSAGVWPQLALLLGISLLVSASGFYRVVYFVSLGYGFSIAALGLATPVLHWRQLDVWSLLHCAALVLYGLRLGVFLLARERSPGYRKELAEVEQRGAHITGPVKVAIWVGVALLYVAMFAPALFVLEARRLGAWAGWGPWALGAGLAIMAGGLALESLADRQKSAYKAIRPDRFCDTGLYRWVRCPNYLGECFFWVGQLVAGLGAYRDAGQWSIAVAGFVCIQLVMLGSTRRLELKQDERYGEDPEYRRYTQSVPVLFPWVPVYSLRDWKIYLG